MLWEQPNGPLELHTEDAAMSSDSDPGRVHYKARDFAARHQLGLHLALNFFETRAGTLEDSFDRAWWYVSDDQSLAQLAHLMPPALKKDEL